MDPCEEQSKAQGDRDDAVATERPEAEAVRDERRSGEVAEREQGDETEQARELVQRSVVQTLHDEDADHETENDRDVRARSVPVESDVQQGAERSETADDETSLDEGLHLHSSIWNLTAPVGLDLQRTSLKGWVGG